MKYKIAKLLGYDLIRRKNSDRTFETHLGRLVRFYQPSHIIDVGANVGQFGQMARALGHKGEIHSFEPVSVCFKKLKEISEKDSHWSIYNFALGEQESRAEITVPSSTDFSSLLKQSDFSKKRFSHRYTSHSTEEINIKVFDEFISNKELGTLSNVFFKTDTQGFDIHVLKGAEKFLKDSVSVVFVELSVIPIYDGMPSYVDTCSYLKQLGFIPSGFYPVTRNKTSFALVEMDGVFVKEV